MPRQPFGTVAIDLLPWELRVGDVVPFDDHIGRPIADIHAVGPGHRARRLILAGLPPLTTRRKLRIYRATQRLSD
ncbi:hypothetical protein BGK70_01265 [Streptomyces agglomeratus]|nr:hypothetical protein BGK70_01265 [Streptomyces agglomeratus]